MNNSIPKYLLTAPVACSLRILKEVAETLGVDVSGAQEGQPFLMPNGLIVDVIPETDAEEATFVVCNRWNEVVVKNAIRGKCIRCGCAIGWSTNAPKRPPKICTDCAEKDAEKRLWGEVRPLN